MPLDAAAAPRPPGTVPKIRLPHFVLLALILTFSAALVLFWTGRPRPFREIARPVCTVPEWQHETLYPSFDNYYWISNTELLIRSSPSAPAASYSFRPVSARAPQSPPTAAVHAAALKDSLVGVSPDGKWAASIDPTATGTLVICLLDGSHRQAWKLPASDWDGLQFWMPDSRRFVMIHSNATKSSHEPTIARVYSLDQARPEVFRVPGLQSVDKNNTGFVGFSASGNAVFQIKSAWFSSARVNNNTAVNYPLVSLVEIDLNDKGRGASPRFFSLSAPRGLDLGYLCLSPRGDRIFWGGFTLTEPSPVNKWLNRWIPAVKAEQRVIQTGWISDADGSRLHQLGFYEIPGDPAPAATTNSKGPPWVLEPRWSPDGRSIAVLFKDTIYTIPVD